MSALSHPDIDDIVLAHAALDATCAVPGVVGISRGRYAIARTFSVGGTAVEGVQMTHCAEGLHLEIHLVVGLVPLLPLAATVRTAVAEVLVDRGVAVSTVDVWIDTLRVADDVHVEVAG